MKITLNKINKSGFTLVNLYEKDIDIKNNICFEKNIDKNTEKKSVKITEKFLNIKSEFKLTDEMNQRKFLMLIRKIILKAKAEKIQKLSLNYNQIRKIQTEVLDKILEKQNAADFDSAWTAKTLIENIFLASYKFEKYKSKKENSLEEILIFGEFSKIEKENFQKGEIVGKAANVARELANTPANDMTPTILAKEAKNLFQNQSGVKVKILEEADVKKLGMNLFLAVGAGSQHPSKFIICEYLAGQKNQRPIVLIGKGITYDTGGLNLKPGSSMNSMIMDMTGGAVSLATLKALVDLKIKKNIIVLVPAVENAISGEAYRPGDILKSLEGITVEIDNTDAEGRLILADAITYAKKYNPQYLFDIATLTGASVVALGEYATATLSKERDLSEKVFRLSEKTGDLTWPLPMWNLYKDYLKSKSADILNSSTSRWGGTISAALFLYEFVSKLPDVKWMHFDIAPRMTANENDNLENGATGEPLRLLVELISEL